MLTRIKIGKASEIKISLFIRIKCRHSIYEIYNSNKIKVVIIIIILIIIINNAIQKLTTILFYVYFTFIYLFKLLFSPMKQQQLQCTRRVDSQPVSRSPSQSSSSSSRSRCRLVMRSAGGRYVRTVVVSNDGARCQCIKAEDRATLWRRLDSGLRR